MNSRDTQPDIRGKRIALAVSGGIDSMVMLHKFARASGASEVFAVTVNHGLRAEAQSDCEFVADYCRTLGVECRVFAVDVPSYAAENKLSEETAARILRYRVFDGLDCDYVFLAHNADDNAETVLMHILRGSGAKGASGMKRVNGRYFRPLLDWTRRDIESYAEANGVPHVEDVTNSDTQYARNFVRHKIMPLLEQFNPAAKQNILRFADNVAFDDALLCERAEQRLAQVRFDENGAHIPVELLADGDYRLLDKVFNRLGVHCDVERKHFLALCELAQNVGGKSVCLPFGYTAYNDYAVLTLCPAKQRFVYAFEIPFRTGITSTPLGRAEASAACAGDLRIDVSKIPDSAVFRTRRTGDVFTKFGGGTKSLNRYLTDKKIPRRNRDSLLLIADGNDVLAIMGVEISDKVRVDGDAVPYGLSLRAD